MSLADTYWERYERGDRLLTSQEVAAHFGASPYTVRRWWRSGRLAGLRTPGGHTRFWLSDVNALLGISDDE